MTKFKAEQVADAIQETLTAISLLEPVEEKVVNIIDVDFIDFFVCYKIFDFFKNKRLVMPNERFQILGCEREYANMVFYGKTVWNDKVTFIIHSEEAFKTTAPSFQPFEKN